MADDRIGVYDRAHKRIVPIVFGVEPIHQSKGSPWPGIKLEHFQVEELCTAEGSTNFYLSALCLRADSGATLGPAGNLAVIEPEEMIVAGPGKVQAQQSTGAIEFLLLEIAPRYLMWAAEELLSGDHFDGCSCWRTRDDPLRHIMLAMHHELLAGFPSGRLFGEYMGLSFATTLLGKRCSQAQRAAGYRGGLSPAKLRLVKSFINENLASNLSLTDIANLVQMGPCHFARAFKESTGLSPHQYVLRRRIDRAVEMLKDERSSLAGIAYDFGFSSQGHFTTVFRKFTGTQPGNYRAQLLSLKQVTTLHPAKFTTGGPLQP
jgi:AraC family transcriptional regulator